MRLEAHGDAIPVEQKALEGLKHGRECLARVLLDDDGHAAEGGRVEYAHAPPRPRRAKAEGGSQHLLSEIDGRWWGGGGEGEG